MSDARTSRPPPAPPPTANATPTPTFSRFAAVHEIQRAADAAPSGKVP